jgi:replication-associated recombination protein RarA
MIETKSIMNMLFYGKVGTGKTSAAGPFEDCTDLDGFRQHMFAKFDGLSMKNLAFVRKGTIGWLSALPN